MVNSIIACVGSCQFDPCFDRARRERTVYAGGAVARELRSARRASGGFSHAPRCPHTHVRPFALRPDAPPHTQFGPQEFPPQNSPGAGFGETFTLMGAARAISREQFRGLGSRRPNSCDEKWVYHLPWPRAFTPQPQSRIG